MKKLMDLYGCNTNYIKCDIEQNNGLINAALPIEIIQMIFTNLRDADMQSANKVCHFWKERTLSIAESNITEITKFAKFLDDNLITTDTNQQKILSKLKNSVPPLLELFSSEALHLKKFIYLRNRLKENLFDVLMSLNTEDVRRLKDLSDKNIKLYFFEHIFDSAQIYKNMEIMDRMTDDGLKSIAIRNISMDLAKVIAESDEINTDQKIFLTISIRPIFKKGISRGELMNALESVIWRASHRNRTSLLLDISKVLALYGDIKGALAYLLCITEYKDQDFAHDHLSNVMAKAGRFDHALKFANEIKDDKMRDSAYTKILASTQVGFS